MRARALALCLLLLAAPAVAAAEDPGAAAEAAARELEAAAVALDAAEGARDRVRALTGVVRAYETGLAAMREGLRAVALREDRLARRLAGQEAGIARLLGAIQLIETAPPPVLTLHPSGPLGAARAGMILADVTPALAARADALRRDLDDLAALRLLQQDALATLETALQGVQQARADLSRAISERTDLPRRFTEDPVRTAILIASTETLAGFASGLDEIGAGGSTGRAEAAIDDLDPGTLEWPVAGAVLRRAGEADAAGVRREGIVLATRPRALVTAPAAATIRYRGPLLDLGTVVILEPAADLLIVLAGMETAFGETGQILAAGAPVGLMGGEEPQQIDAISSPSGEGTGRELTESLYIEVRRSTEPVDPETWFRTDKDGR